MCSLFRNKYRIESTRLVGYDYSLPGEYFITICTKDRIHYFGEIRDGRMILSEAGIIARDYWLAIPSHFPSAIIDEFIIMPDHIHGIIIIKSLIQAPNLGASTKEQTPNLGVSTKEQTPNLGASTKEQTPNLGVSSKEQAPNLGASPPAKSGASTSGNPYWKSNSIGSMINQFKRICTITTKTKGLDLIWQPRYYDHIIRSDNALERIRNYIINNPAKWKSK